MGNERITDDRFESCSPDCGVRGSDDAIALSSVYDIWRQKGDSGIYYLFVRGASICDHGNVGSLLPEKCKFVCREPWDTGTSCVRSCRGTACVEKKYVIKHCGWNSLLYVPGSNSILN